MPKAKNLTRKTGKTRQQYAALPIRFDARGEMEVLLLTSRGTRRWVIPKGWPMSKRTPGEAAAREAYEEAGLEGVIRPETPIGQYHYAKALAHRELTIEVSVFVLRVDRQLESWPEQAERETGWFTPEQAAELVAEPELAAILRSARHLADKDFSGRLDG